MMTGTLVTGPSFSSSARSSSCAFVGAIDGRELCAGSGGRALGVGAPGGGRDATTGGRALGIGPGGGGRDAVGGGRVITSGGTGRDGCDEDGGRCDECGACVMTGAGVCCTACCCATTGAGRIG